MLRWLETQLGLLGLPVPRANRVNLLAGRLDSANKPLIFHPSYQSDRWGTATDLLSRVDEMRLAGWDRTKHPDLPLIFQDVADCLASVPLNFPDTADRLDRVLGALSDGQILPPHLLQLSDPVESWPVRWRPVLAKMTIATASVTNPADARPENALRRACEAVLGRKSGGIQPDSSLRFAVARSVTLACEYLSHVLAQAPEALRETAILCEDDHTAYMLDSVLHRYNLPTMGVRLGLATHPVLQLIPLTFSLLWQPVDPQALLDYLTLPVCPIRKRFARRLARSLLKMPGIGSQDWVNTLEEIRRDPEITSEDKEQFVHRYDTFLGHERVERDGLLPTALIATQYKKLAQWAAGYASVLDKEIGEAGYSSGKEGLCQALLALAGQASNLAGLVENQGDSISGPQVTRLLEDLQAQGAGAATFLESARGPVRIRSLAELGHPFQRLIWLGVGTSAMALDPWSPFDRENLRGKCGLDLPDPLAEKKDLRGLEAAGFNRIGESLLAIQLPSDETLVWHPLWIQVRNLFPKDLVENPPVLDDIILRDHPEHDLAPFNPVIETRRPVPPQPPRPLWEFPKGSFHEPDTVSATELEDRLGCPLKWVFSRQLKLKPGSVVRLPADAKLEGNFCHSVLKLWFDANPDERDSDNIARQVGEVFDSRLALDAAPLAQPDRKLKAMQVRHHLVLAVQNLMSCLDRGGYRIVALESKIDGTAFGKKLHGSIDCLAEKIHPPKGEAVIDFKMYNLAKYSSLLAEGKAIQLATYAYSRKEAGGDFPRVAYLVLWDAQLRTPAGSALDGASTQQVLGDGPSIEIVWKQFEAAVKDAGDWLEGKEPVPARPLQDPEGVPPVRPWPKGLELVLDSTLKGPKTQKVCTYCDFKNLCGLEPLQ